MQRLPPQDAEKESLGNSEEQILQMRTAINKTIDLVREETEKKADRLDLDAAQPVLLGSALESPLWQRRNEKKRSKVSGAEGGQETQPL